MIRMYDLPCVCGHSIEEHGHDPVYPGWSGCNECDCVAYEPDKDECAAASADREGGMSDIDIVRSEECEPMNTQPPSHEEVRQLLANFEGSTPWPWRIKTDGNLSNCIEADSGKRLDLQGYKDTGYRVLATFQSCCVSDRYDEQDANAQANARLIAAAPRMAAMLDSLLADNVRLAERIAALEKIVADACIYLTPEQVAALNPQCSGTATGREG